MPGRIPRTSRRSTATPTAPGLASAAPSRRSRGIPRWSNQTRRRRIERSVGPGDGKEGKSDYLGRSISVVRRNDKLPGDKAGRDYMNSTGRARSSNATGIIPIRRTFSRRENFPSPSRGRTGSKTRTQKVRRWIGLRTPIRSSSASTQSAFRNERRTRRRPGSFTISHVDRRPEPSLPTKAS
mgnify:CR=1 FL=1